MKRLFVLLPSLLFFFALNAQNYPYRSNVLWVTTPDHTDWLYKVNEEAKVTVSLYEYGMLLEDGMQISYSVGPELMPSDKTGAVVIKKGKAVISMGTSSKPGFRDLKLSVTRDGKEYKHHIKVGFEPEKLKPYTQFPNDFDSFWEEAKEEAANCPMVVEKEFIPKYSNDKIDCYLIKLQAYKKNQFVYGYLTLPKRAGKYPIVFAPPGAGIKPMSLKHLFYAESGIIRFDMEIHGIRPDLDRERYNEISRAFGNRNNSYLVNGLDNKDNYYMKKVYLSCVRALDFLTSLPEWDGKNLIAQGGSQGGALALITTGLDSRITACAANHPALSDMAGYKAGRAGGYPHLFTKFDGMDTAEKLNTLAYYDVVNFAKLIKVPTFMTWGYNDDTCPPTTSYIVYNILDTEKEALITPVNEHWVSTETRHVILNWIKKGLKVK
ncbi:acetylxylan esterase [Flammeovirgaceae bacterium SG7u.111]|nr:acetylxylan esterase [Flammeovirgaceae bacterium SG7u.132]WPO34992.1 acetylxylan esterase [Flammeovirgaceae bacterium SG7u.111]